MFADQSRVYASVVLLKSNQLTSEFHGIERVGPIALVELADRVGRDYTTVSRQVSKLERLGLVTREANSVDRRVRKVAITSQGKTMTNRIDSARARIGRTILASWAPDEVEMLIRLMRKFADALK